MLETIQAIDGAALLAIQDIRVEFLNPVVEAFTSMGNLGLLFIVLSVLMLFGKKTRKAGFFALLAMLFGMLCTNVTLKHLVARPRPWLDVPGLIHLVNEPDPNSFPSGHTCAAFSACMVWAEVLKERWQKWAAVILAFCMGLSRLYVGVHYPTDVLVGAIVGCLCAWLSLTLMRYYEKKSALKHS